MHYNVNIPHKDLKYSEDGNAEREFFRVYLSGSQESRCMISNIINVVYSLAMYRYRGF